MRTQLSKNVNLKKIKREEDQKSNIKDVPFCVKSVLYILTTLLSISAFIPLLLTFMVSITDNDTLIANGYSLAPEKFSLEAYRYIIEHGQQIFNAYGVTISVTVLGTILGVFIMSMVAYVLSRNSFPWKSQFTFVFYFTMLFSGGLVPSYIVNTQLLHLKDTFTVLVLPSCIYVSHLLILRTYMRTNVPEEVIESAKMDGAGDFLCYYKIVMPMAVPALMTITLFVAVCYWNDWNTGLLYILRRNDLVSIQLYLKRIENELQSYWNANLTSGMNMNDLEKARESLPLESMKMAIVMITVLPILIAYPFFQQFFVKGITVGAVKG